MITKNHIQARNIEPGLVAQAALRLKLGIPLLLLMILDLAYWGASMSFFGPPQIAIFSIAYIIYSISIYILTCRSQLDSAQRIPIFTAVLDPIMLSICIIMLAHGSEIFVCFYLFSILGYGLRFGTVPMRVCQIFSLIGFGAVVLLSPVWQRHPMVSVSIAFSLVVVPLYAGTLVTRLRVAQERAEIENHNKSLVLMSISHELRMPLSGIVSLAQLIGEEARDHSIVGRADAILKLAGELNNGINNIVDSDKYHASAIVLESQPFDLTDVIEHIRVVLGPIADVKGIELEIWLDERIKGLVVGDVHQLTSVLLNLGSNALKFTERGRVSISCNLVDEAVDRLALFFQVRDTGIGISSELCQPLTAINLRRSESCNSNLRNGSGIGIVKKILSEMHSELCLESKPNRGSLFWFRLELKKFVGCDVSSSNQIGAKNIPEESGNLCHSGVNDCGSGSLNVLSAADYINQKALDALREIADAPGFIVQIFSTGIVDIQRLGRNIVFALDIGDIAAVHRCAHALQGVSLNLGATRLAALARELMTVSVVDLQMAKARWRHDVILTVKHSIIKLRELLLTSA